MGAEQRVSRAQTRERGPPSALAEIYVILGMLSHPTPLRRKFSGTHVCRVAFKHFSQPLKSHIRCFGPAHSLLVQVDGRADAGYSKIKTNLSLAF
jgi:hypothetical protein